MSKIGAKGGNVLALSHIKDGVIMLNYICRVAKTKPVSEQKLMDDIFCISQSLRKRGIHVEQRLSPNPYVEHWSEQISDALDYYSKVNAITIRHHCKSDRSFYFFSRGKCINAVISVVNDGYDQKILQELEKEIESRLSKT